MKQLISPDHGRRVGVYDEEKKILYKYGVKKSKHFFRKANSWGMDSWIINDFLPDEAIIILHSVEEGVYYKTTRKTFKEHGKYLNYLKHSLQLFLSLEHWEYQNDHGLPNYHQRKRHNQVGRGDTLPPSIPSVDIPVSLGDKKTI